VQQQIHSLTDLAQRYISKNEPVKALQVYEQILGKNPSSLDALFTAAQIAIGLNRKDKAIEYYTRILKLDPKNSVVADQLRVLKQRNQFYGAQRPEQY
jgi:tetratricopeptide (TPR) repeat protein